MEDAHKQWLGFWNDENEAAFLYREMAKNEKSQNLKDFYNKLAEIETSHALVWEKRLTEAGVSVPPYKLCFRARILAFVARKFGNRTLVESMNANEDGASSAYASLAADIPEARGMANDEKSHSRAFQALIGTKLDASCIAGSESAHKSAGGNALRAGVMGANDGLVSNFCLVMGMAGATDAAGQGGSVLLLTGIAGLLAGAISMALGEWLSVQSSRELYEKQIAVEKAELEGGPQEEIEELTLIYQAKGLSAEEAHTMAERMAQNDKAMLDTLAREELGINPDDLGGSAWEAAFTSFILFAIGAIIPVIPFFFMTQSLNAVILSAVLSFLGLFGLGAATSLMTGRNLWFSGLRQAFFGILASIVTFAVGKLIGVSVAG